MKRIGAAMLLLGLALGGWAQTNAPNAVTAEACYQAGLEKQTQAELATRPEDARLLYREAIAEYQAAVAAQPAHYQAQVYWGISLTQLAVITPEVPSRNQYLIAATGRFAAATKCPGADYVAYEQWAVLLRTYIYSLVPNQEQRFTVLKEIVTVCQDGLTLAREAGPRAELEHYLGQALQQWADATTAPEEKQRLQQQADHHLRAAGLALTAQQRFQAGLAAQAAAEMAASAADAHRLYRDAIAHYQAALQAQPDHDRAALLWATALTQLVPLAATPADRLQLARQAEAQFAAASRAPNPSATVFEQWASLLVGTLYPLVADRAAQAALLEQTVDVCQRGLPLATEPTPRAQLQRRLGSALMWLVDFQTDPPAKRALLERAIEQLRAANAVVTVRQTLYQNGYLGIALLSLGRLINDPNRLHQAATEFAAALQFYPNQVDTHYNLAATDALLGDADQAGQHLAVAIDHDPQGEYSRLAARDPDLARVRGTAAYTAALDRRRRQAAEVRATALLDQARRAQESAEHTNDLLAATALWRQAAALADQASELTPDLFAVRALGATALARLAALSREDAAEHRRCLDAARARFAAAAQCPGVDPEFYDQWSTFLLDSYRPVLRTTPQQDALLIEARHVLEDGITRARFTGLRGRLESQLGGCLVRLAQVQPSATNATPLYAEAVKHFQTAATADAGTASVEVQELWGWALLRTGQAAKDKLLIRQGIERFLRAVELQPDMAGPQYGLACAYAQLRQFDQAMRHLQRCLAHDPHGQWHTQAERDADLRALRQTDAFHRVFRQRTPLEPATGATISEK